MRSFRASAMDDASNFWSRWPQKKGTRMTTLNREDFCRLAGLNEEALKTLQRRGQVPTVPGPCAMGYTPFAALLQVIANEFAEQGINRTRAAFLAGTGVAGLAERWTDIAESSETLFLGRQDPHVEMFLAIAEGGRGRSATCGTLAQVSRKFPSPVRLALANVSRAAALVRVRAARHKIDLNGFW